MPSSLAPPTHCLDLSQRLPENLSDWKCFGDVLVLSKLENDDRQSLTQINLNVSEVCPASHCVVLLRVSYNLFLPEFIFIQIYIFFVSSRFLGF